MTFRLNGTTVVSPGTITESFDLTIVDRDVGNFSVYSEVELDNPFFQPLILYLALLIGALILLTMVLLLVVPWFFRRRKKLRQQLSFQSIIQKRKNCYVLNNKIICDEISQTDGCEAKMGCVLKTLLSEDQQKKLRPWLVHRKDVELVELVGEGAFAYVYRGRFLKDHPPTLIAMKNLKDSCGKTEIVSFVEEALVMSEFRHPNVLGLIAVTVDQTLQLPIIVTPYMQNGDLRSYLKKRRHHREHDEVIPSLQRRLQFALHIASGMHYLVKLKYIHRDLATRNCMLNEFMVVKIGDFGLARKATSDLTFQLSREVCLPVRWMAPESLKHGIFSEKSDVWSYGVTLWELLTFAKIPYSSLSNGDILQFLESGGQLEKAEDCPDEICLLMDRCFSRMPEDRSSFCDIVAFLQDFIAVSAGYLTLYPSIPYQHSEGLV